MIAHRWSEKCCIKLLARGYSIDGENADLEIRIYRDLVKGKLAKAHFIHLFCVKQSLHNISAQCKISYNVSSILSSIQLL